MENVTLIRHTEGKINKGIQRMSYLETFCKRMEEQELDVIVKKSILLKDINDSKLRRSMVTHVFIRRGTGIKKKFALTLAVCKVESSIGIYLPTVNMR